MPDCVVDALEQITVSRLGGRLQTVSDLELQHIVGVLGEGLTTVGRKAELHLLFKLEGDALHLLLSLTLGHLRRRRPRHTLADLLAADVGPLTYGNLI